MSRQNFIFRCIVYQEKERTFTGVCLDLDIVEEGHNSLQGAIFSINDAITSHMRVAAKLGFPKELIERPAPKEYWNKLTSFTRLRPTRPLSTVPFQAYTIQPPLMPRVSYA